LKYSTKETGNNLKVTNLGRRRRRVIMVVKKKLPTVFSCPSCGEEAIRVVMSRGKGHALIQCASCGLKQEVETSPVDQMVDVYCRFTDKFYGASQPSAPKEVQTQAEETVSPVTSEAQETEEKSEPEEDAPPAEESASVPEEQIEASETAEQTSDEPDESQESQVNEETSNRPQTGL
jgi:transcription elongation factor Elf1